MHTDYGRDLDLNLLRVFVVVAEAGSVTEAASRLYLTQPAVSAALGRLSRAVGGALFARSGRGLSLTARGERLLADGRPHLQALVAAALSPSVFDPATSDRTIRIGLSDSTEGWLLPTLLRIFEQHAPLMRLVVVPVQFRTVSERLASGAVDVAVTVADELPAGTRRQPLFTGGFVCLHDPRRLRLPKRLTLGRYLEEDHAVVSYNGDLRGIVEDALGVSRRVRLSVPTFESLGAALDGSVLLGTVPEIVAKQIRLMRPHLATVELPFKLGGTPVELLWRSASDDDAALAFLRSHIVRIAAAEARPSKRR